MSLVVVNEAYLSLILNKSPSLAQQMQYVKFFQKCYLSACLARSMNIEQKQKLDAFISSHQFSLPRNFSKKKTLFVNLDKTLVISSLQKNPALGETFNFKDATLYFSVRPYAVEFLKQISEFYEIVLYSTAVANYTIEFFQYFNEKTNGAIKKCLNREHCVQLQPNLFIQDLRLIKNRDPSKMVLLSNQILAFRQCIGNGVPISPYKGDPNDRELFYVLDHLIKASKCEDAREYNLNHFRLEQILCPATVVKEETFNLQDSQSTLSH